MKNKAFGFFLGFGIFTILLAWGGGLWAVTRSAAGAGKWMGGLTIALGTLLAVTLGSLFWAQARGKKASSR